MRRSKKLERPLCVLNGRTALYKKVMKRQAAESNPFLCAISVSWKGLCCCGRTSNEKVSGGTQKAQYGSVEGIWSRDVDSVGSKVDELQLAV